MRRDIAHDQTTVQPTLRQEQNAMDTQMTRRGAMALGSGVVAMALGVGREAVRSAALTPRASKGVLVVHDRERGLESNSLVEFEVDHAGRYQMRVIRWANDVDGFTDVRTINLPRETFASIEAALFSPATEGGSA